MAHLFFFRFENSWHLNPDASASQSELGMNIQAAWEMGFTGKGVSVVHIDNGIDRHHPDLWFNYNPATSTDLSGPVVGRPCNSSSCSHGTEMAGIVGALGHNRYCSVGIAHHARIGMVKVFDGLEGRFTDLKDAAALSYKGNEGVDIYVIGLGPSDTGGNLAKLGNVTRKALEHGLERGRNGKGVIFLSPAGNGGLSFDACSQDEKQNHVATLTVNALGQDGNAPSFAESCTSIMASAYSAGSTTRQRSIVTTTVNNGCTSAFSGTSSSIAVSGGVMALVLQANPSLTWRCVQHLVVRGVRPKDEVDSSVEWSRNGVGRWYSPTIGYVALLARPKIA